MEKEEIPFEEAMTKLESITVELEKGNLSLEESMAKFEEGMKLSKTCNEILQNAEKKITILLEENGTLKEENFDPTKEGAEN